MKKPDVWMIAISGNSISMHYRNLVVDSWRNFGHTVNHFEAVTPEDLKLEQYQLLPIKKKHSNRTNKSVEFTETEIAVWYSHYYTWKLCFEMDEPIIVAEHDIQLLKEIDSEVYNYNIACLAHVLRKNKIVQLGGGSYYITPKGAKELLRIRHDKAIIKNSDAWIHNRCDKMGKWFHYHSIQIKDDAIGVTVFHN
jgi:GR25 family glycosyltransferase involved in LPS biosynthesis